MRHLHIYFSASSAEASGSAFSAVPGWLRRGRIFAEQTVDVLFNVLRQLSGLCRHFFGGFGRGGLRVIAGLRLRFRRVSGSCAGDGPSGGSG